MALRCDAPDCDAAVEGSCPDDLPPGWCLVRLREQMPDVRLPAAVADALQSFMDIVSSVGEPPKPRWRAYVLCPDHELPVPPGRAPPEIVLDD